MGFQFWGPFPYVAPHLAVSPYWEYLNDPHVFDPAAALYEKETEAIMLSFLLSNIQRFFKFW